MKAINSGKTKVINGAKWKTGKIKPMTMEQIKQKAVYLGIQPSTMNKTELIHSIQRAEGCTPCFGTSNSQCPYTDCCFMPDCLKI